MPLSRSYISNRAFRAASGARIVPSAIIKETFTNPATADTDGFSEIHAGADAAGTTEAPLDGDLAGVNPVPRNVVITVTHASSVVAMSGVITGTDVNGEVITEAWSVTATGTSKTFTGAVAFKTVTSVTEVVAADASANSIIVGQGVKFGLATKAAIASIVKEVSAGSIVTNGTLVAASSSANADRRGTYAPNTAPDGTKTYVIYYLSDDPENDLARA